MDEDPSFKIPAFKKATEEHDFAAITQMVADLDSQDPAVRFYAIEGLKRLTNETFGYRYSQDELERKPALDQWKKWLTDHPNNKP